MNTNSYTTNYLKRTLGCLFLSVVLLSPCLTKAQFNLAAINNAGLNTIPGQETKGIRSADIDNDGKPDIVLCFGSNNSVQIFLNSSTGKGNLETSFLAPTIISFNAASANNIFLADLTRDGLPEIILSNGGAGTLLILQNTSKPGNLSFGAAQEFLCPGTSSFVTVCDLNADGFNDIIAACGEDLAIFCNTTVSKGAALSLNECAVYPVSGAIHDIKCADFDGDGNADIVAGLSDGVSILKNITQGSSQDISFADAVLHNTGRSVFSLDIGDLDNDFKTDIVTANWPNADFSILQNNSENGIITFSPPVLVEAASPQGIVLGDFDQDGKFDVATMGSGNGLMVTEMFKNISTGEGDFSFAAAQSFMPLSTKIIANDFDRDGSEDIAGLNAEGTRLVVLAKNTNSELAIKPELAVYCGEDGKVWMDWNVSKTNTSTTYTIEKTTDGTVFHALGTAEAGEVSGGNINYSFSDTNAAVDIAYYRLRMTDTDGVSKYSAMQISQPCSNAVTEFVCAYPNPVDRIMNFHFSINTPMEMHYSIMDLNMQIQMEKTELVTAGTRTYSLDITQIQKGSYIFVVSFGNLPPKVCRFEKL